MKKSIRKQIVTAFLGFLFLSIALIVLANYGFMEKVYLHKKEEILKDAYNEIILNYGSVDESDLTRFCSTNNLSAVIYNINTIPVKDYSNVRVEDANRLKTRLFGYLAGLEPEGDKIFEKNSVYTILYNRDKMVKMDFLEMWGKTEEGIVFILRCPIERKCEYFQPFLFIHWNCNCHCRCMFYQYIFKKDYKTDHRAYGNFSADGKS